MSRVIVIDERKGALKEDLSNVVVESGDPANLDSIRGVKEGDARRRDLVVVMVTPEGVNVYEGEEAVKSCTVARVKGESEISLEEAKAQSAARQHGSGSRPSDTPGAVERFAGMWTANQGEDDTGQSAGDSFR